MSDEIRVNGNLYSWGSIRFKVGNELFTGFTEISYADKRERTKGYGMARHHAPIGRTAGKYSTEPVKVKGYKKSVRALREALAALSADGVSYGNVESLINVQYIEGDDSPHNDEIERYVNSSDSSSHTESPDPLMDDIELDCMLIRRNGLTLFDSTEGSP